MNNSLKAMLLKSKFDEMIRNKMLITIELRFINHLSHFSSSSAKVNKKAKFEAVKLLNEIENIFYQLSAELDEFEALSLKITNEVQKIISLLETKGIQISSDLKQDLYDLISIQKLNDRVDSQIDEINSALLSLMETLLENRDDLNEYF
jgi:hypothetical protein